MKLQVCLHTVKYLCGLEVKASIINAAWILMKGIPISSDFEALYVKVKDKSVLIEKNQRIGQDSM